MKTQLQWFLRVSLAIAVVMSLYQVGAYSALICITSTVAIIGAYFLNQWIHRKVEDEGVAALAVTLVGMVALIPYFTVSFILIIGLFLFYEKHANSGVEYLIAGIVLVYSLLSWIAFRTPRNREPNK